MNQQTNWASGLNWGQLPMTNQMQGNYGALPQMPMNTPVTPLPGLGGSGMGFNVNIPGAGNAGGGGIFGGLNNFMQSDTGRTWFGGVNEQGVSTPGLAGGLFDMGSKIAGAWGGMQQLDLAKKQFGLQKDMMTKNYNAQKGLTNTRMRDRQNARTAASESLYQDTDSYMKENEVK